ncbi:MAG: hypothetical protein ACI90V_008269, partial [Bacillariaceae sp.]
MISSSKTKTKSKSRRIGGFLIFGIFLLVGSFGITIVFILHDRISISLSSMSLLSISEEDMPTATATATAKTTVFMKATTTSSSSSSHMLFEKQKQQKDDIGIDINNQDSSGHFSACTLWMDDNHRLDEWIAYHYYILKLRYVVIGIDPYSKTSPTEIIQKWNKHNFNKVGLLADNNNNNIKIIGWNETEYVSTKIRIQNQNELDKIENKYKYKYKHNNNNNKSDNNNNNDNNDTSTTFTLLYGTAKTNQYLQRQRLFMKECTRHMSSLNKTWVSYHDLDEYISFQHKTDGIIKDAGQDITQMGQQKFIDQGPYYIFNRLNTIKQSAQQEHLEQLIKNSDTTTATATATATAATKEEDDNENNDNEFLRLYGGNNTESLMGCISILRKRFCSKELDSPAANEIKNDVLLSSVSAEYNNNNNNNILPNELLQQLIFYNNNEDDKYDDKYEDDFIKRFDTLRYKYLTPNRDGQPKSFIDLSQPGPKAYARGEYLSGQGDKKDDIIKYSSSKIVWNPHTVMPIYCRNEELRRSKTITSILENEKFVINHYLGSWESYARPNDSRIGGLRTYDAWLERSNFTNGQYSTVSRPWLKGFIQLVGGPKIAAHLLQDAG